MNRMYRRRRFRHLAAVAMLISTLAGWKWSEATAEAATGSRLSASWTKILPAGGCGASVVRSCASRRSSKKTLGLTIESFSSSKVDR